MTEKIVFAGHHSFDVTTKTSIVKAAADFFFVESSTNNLAESKVLRPVELCFQNP